MKRVIIFSVIAACLIFCLSSIYADDFENFWAVYDYSHVEPVTVFGFQFQNGVFLFLLSG